MKKNAIFGAILTAVLALILGLSALQPMVACNVDMPDQYLEAVEGQAKGVYSRMLPLVPIYVSVENFSQERVYYTIYYFPFGTVGMSYAENDGYNIEKPLTRS